MLTSLLERFQSGETMVFGHRGAKAYAPMNTLAAFELAFQQGAQGIELDVHRSKDGYPVIVHDFTVDETTDGDGLVTEMSLAELKELDAGGWFDEKFQGERIPTLDEVFEMLDDEAFVNVEIKSESAETDGVEQVVANCIQRHNMAGRVIVSSFNPLALRRFRELAPDMMIGFLFMPGGLEIADDLLGDLVYQAQHPFHNMIDTAFMEQARQQGYFVTTWTVNDIDRAITLQSIGVNCIITDVPDVILSAIHS